MKSVFTLFLLTIVTFCEGSLIEGILNGALDVNSKVHEAAGAFLGGLSHGVNIGGQVGFNAQGQGGHNRHPPHYGQNKPGKPDETIIVVVEDSDRPGYGGNGQNQNGYGNHNRPHHHKPGHHQNPYQNNGNPYGNQNFNNNGNGNWHNSNQGNGQYGNQGSPNWKPNNQYGNPHNQNGNPHNQFGNPNNQYPNNQYGNQNNQYENSYNNRPNNQYGNPNNQQNANNQYGNNKPNNYGNYNRPSFSTENPDQNRPNLQEQTTENFNKPEKNPTDNTVKPPSGTNYGHNDSPKPNNGQNTDGYNNNVEKTTKNPTGADDYPLFVPLNPNEYVYGGDKIEVNAPKRETDSNSKPKPADDEDLPIDIRIQNE